MCTAVERLPGCFARPKVVFFEEKTCFATTKTMLVGYMIQVKYDRRPQRSIQPYCSPQPSPRLDMTL